MLESPVGVPRTPTIVGSVRRYILLSLVVFDACVLAAVAVSVLVAPKPVATAQLSLDDPRGNSVFRQSNLPPADLAAYATGRASFAHSEPVLSRASQLLGGRRSPADLVAATSAALGANSNIIEVQSTGGSKDEAVATANAVATAYRELSAAQTRSDADTALRSLDASRRAALASSSGQSADALRSLSQTRSDLDARASEIRLNAALFDDGVSYVQPADTSQLGSTGSIVRNVVAGALLGLLLGVGAAVAVASRQRPLEDPDGAQEILGAPLLGELSHGRRGSASPQYDVVASALKAAVPQGTVAIINCEPGKSASDAAANIALALASAGARVGLLDAGGGHYHGLSAVLAAGQEVPAVDGMVEVGFADARRTPEVLASLADLHSRCDLVVVLCPSVEEPGAAQILRASDGALVLVPEGALSARLAHLRHVLTLLDVTVLGYVYTRGRIPFLGTPARSAALQRS